MVIADQQVPADVVDRLLWLEAQDMLGQHASPDVDGNCVWCGWRWPCAPRRLALRAEAAARRPWREAYTLRHDLNSIRAMPTLRAGRSDNVARVRRRADLPRGARRGDTNRGYFD
ncbi:MAG: hypothetical protein ABW022_21305 [Actinoplanes sp.]